MSEITPEQLHQAAERLQAIEDELGQIASWLTLGDQDRAAIVLEDAWKAVSAAENLLRRAVRTRPAGWLNGQSYSSYGPRRG